MLFVFPLPFSFFRFSLLQLLFFILHQNMQPSSSLYYLLLFRSPILPPPPFPNMLFDNAHIHLYRPFQALESFVNYPPAAPIPRSPFRPALCPSFPVHLLFDGSPPPSPLPPPLPKSQSFISAGTWLLIGRLIALNAQSLGNHQLLSFSATYRGISLVNL